MKEERLLIVLGVAALMVMALVGALARGETSPLPPADAGRDRLAEFLATRNAPAVATPDPLADAIAANLKSGWSAVMEGECAWAAYHAQNALEIAQGESLPLAEADAEHLMASAMLCAGNLAEGIERLERSLALRPENVPALFRLARAYEDAGRQTEAIADYREVVRLVAEGHSSQHTLAEAALEALSRLEE